MGKNKRTILLNGACGRMGQAIVNVCRNSSDFEIRYALEHPQHNKIGTNLYASRDKKKYSLKNIPIEKSIDKFKVDFVIEKNTNFAVVQHECGCQHCFKNFKRKYFVF